MLEIEAAGKSLSADGNIFIFFLNIFLTSPGFESTSG